MNPAVSDTSVPWSPEAEHTGELIRLHKLLAGSAGRFSLVLVCYDQPVYRGRLIAHLRSVLPGLAQTMLDANDLAGIVDLERYLTQHADERGPLHLVGLDRWFSMETDGDAARRRIAGFNLHRDYLAALARRPLFLWLLKHQVREFARLAPDAWEWRAAVLDFARRVPTSGLDLPARVDHGHAPREDRVQRIDEIERFLSRHDTSLSPGERAVLWDELGDLHENLGDWGAAQRAYEAAQGQYDLLDDQRRTAQERAKIAHLLWRRGDPDQALRSLATSSAAFERLGDVRSKAVTQGKIADILQARGQLDESLRIHKEEELPVYERVGDVHSKSAALFKIAQINLARETYPEAMAGLAQSYAIVEGLHDAQGLAYVGKLYGQLLCASGEQARGRVVLEKAVGAFALLGQDDEAQAIQKIIRELQDGKPD